LLRNAIASGPLTLPIDFEASAFLLLLALTASCAPLATLRPVSALTAQGTHALGLGTVAVSPRPYVDERWSHAGQAWFTTKATPWLQLSGISAFDVSALGVGVGATALVVRSSGFMAGVEAEGGYGWAGAGLPFAARHFEHTWIYAEPRVTNFGIHPSLGTPVGLSLHIEKGAFLRLEYQASWQQLQKYNLRHHLAAGFAVQW
jgi:hypothetical protein